MKMTAIITIRENAINTHHNKHTSLELPLRWCVLLTFPTLCNATPKCPMGLPLSAAELLGA